MHSNEDPTRPKKKKKKIGEKKKTTGHNWKRQRMPNHDHNVTGAEVKRETNVDISRVGLQPCGEKTLRSEDTWAGFNLKAN